MTPLAVNPNVVVLIKDGKVVKLATNIAPDVHVTVTNDENHFNDAARGQSYVQTN